jgi:dihydrolipoamide dehydrogenase
VIATGSVPIPLDGVTIDEKRICTSEGILRLPEIPKHLIVIGGGYIGLEMGSVWGRLGSQITCVELMDRIIPTMDRELATHLQKILKEQGFQFRLNTKVTESQEDDQTVTLSVSSSDHAANGREEISGSHVLVAAGRRPFTNDLGLERVGVEVTEQGFITVDERFRTSVEGIYAIGDVAREPMLAHKAQDEGLACVEAIGGGNGYINYDTIPAVIYTSPEVASVGKTEEELKEKGWNYRVGKFPFRANSRAWCVGQAKEGFVKILADSKNDLVLGGHIVGPDAGTLIHEIVTTMEFGATAEELGRTSHGHPTFNEAIREAALAVHERAIHQ